MTVGERIEQARQLRDNMSRPALARLTGIPYPTLAGLENGDQKDSTKLHVIADALKVNVRWLQSGKGPRDAEPASSSQSVGLDLPTIATAVRLLEILAATRGTPPPVISPIALLVALETVREAESSLDDSNVVDFMQRFAARLKDMEERNGTQRGTTSGTGKAVGASDGARRTRKT